MGLFSCLGGVHLGRGVSLGTTLYGCLDKNVFKMFLLVYNVNWVRDSVRNKQKILEDM